MNFNKKAAMELGISTVVMLVIAIVIIGAGIAFIRSFFGTGTDTLVGAFEVADFGLEPTSGRPLVLTDGQVSIKRGNEATVRIGFYNKENSEYDVNIEFKECISSRENPSCTDGDNVLKPQIISLKQRLPPGESTGFSTQVTAKCDGADDTSYDMVPGTYTCNLIASGVLPSGDGSNIELARTQIVLTVTS